MRMTFQRCSLKTYWETIVVWSDEVKDVILVELKVGDESNFSDQVVRKEAR